MSEAYQLVGKGLRYVNCTPFVRQYGILNNWSEPRYLNIKLSESESFLGVCPGRGLAAAIV